ncbi:hypothetical protein Hbl1158_04055 [Halobaculum sp. CBA1158]|uniref:DUF7553 family protein n=1 Tax=Halobaculum sp. CBA1158 TaxID=2904243 RepID=UPI001F3C2F5D|nr:hypothetical protein [Halobaculum sp. CBA1158]UIP00543.1 hypothetical protein Hbl1158_04055 [Halobaculum sp. CBA1158]
MSKHFEDARYYLGRAAEHAKEGVKEELEPVEERVRELVGKEKVPEPSRLDRLESDLKELSGKAEGEAKEAVQDARERLRDYRESRSSE